MIPPIRNFYLYSALLKKYFALLQKSFVRRTFGYTFFQTNRSFSQTILLCYYYYHNLEYTCFQTNQSFLQTILLCYYRYRSAAYTLFQTNQSFSQTIHSFRSNFPLCLFEMIL